MWNSIFGSGKSEPEPQIQIPQSQSNYNRFKKKCKGNNQPQHICVKKQCHIPSQFICSSKYCECVAVHEECQKLPYRVFLKKIQSSANHQTMEELNVRRVFDGLISQLTNKKNQIIRKIRQGQSDHLFEIQQVEMSGLTRSNISSIIGVPSQSDVKFKVEDIFYKLQPAIKQLKQNHIQTAVKKIESSLFNPPQNVYFSASQFTSPINSVINNRIKCQSDQKGAEKADLTLLWQNIHQIKGNVLKWRVKIIHLFNQIAVGICLRQVAKKAGFKLKKTEWKSQNSHGLYAVSSNYDCRAYKSKQQNKKIHNIDFEQGDIISVELNKQLKTLKFRNQRTKSQQQLDIQFQPDVSKDGYHISIVLWGKGDEVQFLSPMETELGQVKVGTEW